MKLVEQAKKLPLKPGVYQFIGVNREILYIGRATNLRRRVSQYFLPNKEPRLKEMVALAKNIKYEETDSVLEAIILEANKIKKHWPKYNIKDKDNRSFVYLVIPLTDVYPKPLIVRGRELERLSLKSGSKVFGPYQNSTALKNILRMLRRFFPYSTCRPNSGKACFDYQVGLCPGTCLGLIDPVVYKKNIKSLAEFFAGRKKQLLKRLSRDNPDLAKALKNINDVSLITQDELNDDGTDGRIEAYDISHFSGSETVGSMVVFVNGKPEKSEYRLFNIKSVGNNDVEALTEVLTRRLKHQEWPLPEIFLIDGGRPQIIKINKLLAEQKITRPLVGISKFGGDSLVFPSGTPKGVRELVSGLKITLLQARDEAHRFANRQRRRRFDKRV